MITGIGQIGVTHDFYCYNGVAEVWDGTAYVVPNPVDFAAYRVTASPDGMGSFKASEPVGTMRYELRVRGATLADSYVVWAESLVTEEIKADPQLGTADGGLVANARRSRQFVTNKRTRAVIGPRQIRYTVRSDDDTADEFSVDYDPLTGNMSPV